MNEMHFGLVVLEPNVSDYKSIYSNCLAGFDFMYSDFDTPVDSDFDTPVARLPLCFMTIYRTLTRTYRRIRRTSQAIWNKSPLPGKFLSKICPGSTDYLSSPSRTSARHHYTSPIAGRDK